MSCYIKLTFSRIMCGPLTRITLIRQLLTFLNNLRNILQTDISNGIPWLFFFLWPSNGLDSHRCNQPLSWYSLIIFWLWRCDYHIVQTTKIQRDVQSDVILTIPDLSVFPTILKNTIFHVHWCELFLLKYLPSVATMINIQWCYNF